MINIIIKETQENGKSSVIIEADGHAGFNPGNDIVCSAVSTLFYAFGAYASSKEGVECNCIFSDGCSKIKALGDIDEAYKMFKMGLKMIEKKYPENICINGV